MQTRDQKYAMDAYTRVCRVKPEEKASYGSMAHKLPILIHRAGLAQALSFVQARGSDSQQNLLQDLQQTIGSQKPLAARARAVELSEYMLLTQQVLDALLWYKRFAQSVLGIEASDTALGDENTNG